MMRRFLLFFLSLFLLSGCKAWASRWAPLPTSFPTPLTRQPPTPEPTSTFDPKLCIYVEVFQPLPDLTSDLLNLYDLAGFRDLEVWAEAYGQVCLDQDKEARGFLPRQTNIRLALNIASLEDLDQVGEVVRDLLEVLESVPQAELPGPDIGTFSITFFSGGSQVQFLFPIDLGRRAYQQGLTGQDLLDVLR